MIEEHVELLKKKVLNFLVMFMWCRAVFVFVDVLLRV